MHRNPTRDELQRLLESTRTVAVLGASDELYRAGYYVPEALFLRGVRIIPVNPTLGAAELFGEHVRSKLAEIGEAIDLVDVFRRPEFLVGHVDDLLTMSPRPSCVWFQSGIRDDHVAGRLEDEGIRVVQDRCLMVDHRALVG